MSGRKLLGSSCGHGIAEGQGTLSAFLFLRFFIVEPDALQIEQKLFLEFLGSVGCCGGWTEVQPVQSCGHVERCSPSVFLFALGVANDSAQ